MISILLNNNNNNNKHGFFGIVKTILHHSCGSQVLSSRSLFHRVYTLVVSSSLIQTHHSFFHSCSSFSSSSSPLPSSSPFPNSPSLPSKPILDLKHFIQNADIHAENLRQRHLHLDLDLPFLVSQAKLYLSTQHQLHSFQHQLTTISKLYSTTFHQTETKSSTPPNTTLHPKSKEELLHQAKQIKSTIQTLQHTLDQLETLLHQELAFLPNFSSPETPIGPTSKAICFKHLGPPLHQFQYHRDHLELCQYLDLVDFIAGSKVTGTSFYFLKRAGALLELALIQFSMQLAQHHGFIPISPPDLVRQSIVKACGFQPRDTSSTQTYSVIHKSNYTSSFSPTLSSTMEHGNETDLDPLALAATAELPLAGMYANTLIPFTQLPLKFVGLGRAFRAESGARGSETRGLYRVHQFSKVELFILSSPESTESLSCFQALLNLQTEFIQQLGLTVRFMEMPTEELGASAYRKVDIEAWFPGRQQWGEISSTSHCTDYQAKKLNIRTHRTPTSSKRTTSGHQGTEEGPWRKPKSNPFVHTLNGTCAAIPRLIIAILEQMQQKDGSVLVPKVLQPYLQMEVIQPPTKK